MDRSNLLHCETLLAVVILCQGCGNLKPGSALRHDAPGRVYVDRQGFSFTPPEGWESQGHDKKYFLKYAAKRESGSDANLTIMSQSDIGTRIASLSERLKRDLAKQAPDIRFVEDGIVPLNGRKAYRVCYEYEDESGPATTLRYYLKGESDVLFTITFRAPKKQFDELRPVFDRCASTILVD